MVFNVTNDFTNGTVSDADEVNTNFGDVEGEFNGTTTDSDIAARVAALEASQVFHYIEEVDLSGGASKTLDSSTLDLSGYRGLMIRLYGSIATTAEGINLRFNDDNSAIYDSAQVSLIADSHGNQTNMTHIIMGHILPLFGGGVVFISMDSGTSYTTAQGFVRGGGFSGEYKSTDAITKINLFTVGNNMNTDMVMQIWGIK